MSFVNPLFLLGALAVAVPILLHLIKREHAHKIEFPTLMFLRRISKRTIRYQKLRHLLLLLLRVLALLLIALVFMRPYREKTQAAAAIGRITTAHIIVLDHSMSMGYQDRWDRAKKAAADIVRKAEPGDKFAVLEFSDRTSAKTLLTDYASDAMSQIEGLELSDQSTRFGQALRAAEKFALEAGTGKRVIHLISDFQRNGWTAEDQDFRIGSGIELQCVDLGTNEFSNLAIRDVHVVESDQGTGNAINIKASVSNFGNVDRKNVLVSLRVDGRSVAEKRVDVAGSGSQAVEFQLPGFISGIHPVVLEVEDPNLTRDNKFYMTVEAREKTPVLMVDGGDSGGTRSSSFFLAKALNVESLSPYKLTLASPQSFALSGGLLIWNNIGGGATSVQKRLQDFVRSGGGMAVVLGGSIQPADFNRSFGSWLPVRMEDSSGSEASARNRPAENYVLMTDIRADHPIFQPFSRPHSGTFSNAKFFNHARIAAGSGAEVLARFDNGDPVLVAVHVDKGRVLIFASSADDSANDLPLKAVYAPFWQQMLHYLENFQERRHWVEVGETIAPKQLLTDASMRQSKGTLEVNESVAVLDPDKQRLSIAPGSDSVAADKAGFYEIRSMNVNAPVAVNAAAKESDLAHGNAEEMKSGWTSSESSAFIQDERPLPEDQDRRQRLWVLLLIAAALLLISELFLANHKVFAGSAGVSPAQSLAEQKHGSN